jgi:hypothetical protein
VNREHLNREPVTFTKEKIAGEPFFYLKKRFGNVKRKSL